ASSLVKARHWVAELQRQASPGIVISLVGNKVDLCDEDGEAAEATEGGEAGEAGVEDDDAAAVVRKVPVKEAQSYADEEGLLFFETSAKSGLNVSEVFTAIANAIPEASLKGARGAAASAAGGGATQAAISAGRDESSRVNLTARGGDKPQEGCAC
ncbi:Vacuolar protein sorting-associated protein 21, partial [Teratosphaeriaceae sp. CCFEE 6253]